jgi:hypothetical protein
MLIVENAIKRAGKIDRKPIRDALATTEGLESLCGQYTYVDNLIIKRLDLNFIELQKRMNINPYNK